MFDLQHTSDSVQCDITICILTHMAFNMCFVSNAITVHSDGRTSRLAPERTKAVMAGECHYVVVFYEWTMD